MANPDNQFRIAARMRFTGNHATALRKNALANGMTATTASPLICHAQTVTAEIGENIVFELPDNPPTHYCVGKVDRILIHGFINDQAAKPHPGLLVQTTAQVFAACGTNALALLHDGSASREQVTAALECELQRAGLRCDAATVSRMTDYALNNGATCSPTSPTPIEPVFDFRFEKPAKPADMAPFTDPALLDRENGGQTNEHVSELPPNAQVTVRVEFAGTEQQAKSVARSLYPDDSEAEIVERVRLKLAWQRVSPEEVEETVLENLAANHSSIAGKLFVPKHIGEISLSHFAAILELASRSHYENYGRSFHVEMADLNAAGVAAVNILRQVAQNH